MSPYSQRASLLHELNVCMHATRSILFGSMKREFYDLDDKVSPIEQGGTLNTWLGLLNRKK